VFVTTTFASEIFSTNGAADMSFAVYLMLEQVIKFFKVHLAKTAPFVFFVFVVLQVLLLGKATDTVLIGTWEVAGVLG
jgi:hypothetical protein